MSSFTSVTIWLQVVILIIQVQKTRFMTGSRVRNLWTHALTKLVEFQETEIPSTNEMTIAEVLYRLETSHDIPSAKLKNFSGDPLTYVEFIESFRIQSHQKFNLTDDQRM